MTIKPLTLTLGGMMALAAAVGIGRFVYTPILPVMAEALPLSKSQAGLLASANFLGYLVGALLAVLPRWPGGERLWLLAALAVNALALAAMGLSDQLLVLAALRFIGGVASALVLIFASALVLERLATSGHSAYTSVHFAGVGVGVVLSAILVSKLLASNATWPTLWFASAGLAAVALVVTAVFVPARRTERRHTSQTPSSSTGRALMSLVIAYGLFGFGYIVTATFIVTMVRETSSIAQLESSIWIVFGLAAAPSVAFWTWLAARLGTLRAYAVASVVQAIGVSASVLWVSLPGIVVSAFFLGGTVMGLTALGLIGARALTRGDPRRALAAMTAAFGLGQMIGPTIGGYLYDMTASFLLPTLIAAGGLLVAAVLVALIEPARAG